MSKKPSKNKRAKSTNKGYSNNNSEKNDILKEIAIYGSFIISLITLIEMFVNVIDDYNQNNPNTGLDILKFVKYFSDFISKQNYAINGILSFSLPYLSAFIIFINGVITIVLAYSIKKLRSFEL